MNAALAPSALRAAPITRRSSAARTARKGALVVRAFRDEDTPTSSKAAATETSELLEAASAKASEVLAIIQDKWEQSEEKPTIVAVGVAALLSLYFADTVVSSIDRLPVISTLFELIGLTVAGWTGYRVIAVPGEKESISQSLKSFVGKVGL